MASSTLIDKKKMHDFSKTPIICRKLLPNITKQVLVEDSFDIRRHPSDSHKNFPFPSEYQRIGVNREFVILEKNLKKTERDLSKKRENLINEVKIIEDRWKNLEDKEEKLKQFFKQYNKFVLNGVEKRRRFLSMTKYQHEKVKKRSAEVEWLELELEKLKIVQVLLRQEISKHSIYDRYMEKVFESSFRFKSIRDMTSSFEVLFESLEKTIRNYRDKVRELGENQKKFEDMISNSTPLLLNLFLQYSRLTKAYDEVKMKNKENEKLVLSICSKINEYAMDYEECIGNVDTLYSILCVRADVKKKFPKYDFKNQLDCIKSELGKRGKMK